MRMTLMFVLLCMVASLPAQAASTVFEASAKCAPLTHRTTLLAVWVVPILWLISKSYR